MNNAPDDIRYASSHEWARLEEDGSITVGISDHAQSSLGDIVFVETPEIGTVLAAGDEAGIIESVKAATDIYAPIGGEVTAVNDTLDEAPDSINADCYHDGWLFKLQPTDAAELNHLLDAGAYEEQCAEE